MGWAVITEATLSFLGLGIPPAFPSWGGMLTGASQVWASASPWLGVFPGIAIITVVLAWNFLGDALRDVLDPRMRGME
jgi:peptide/nickel transport system permease protein